MRIGFLQFRPQWGKKDRNLETVAALLADTQADLIVFPELFSTGYVFTSRPELERLAEEIPAGPTCVALKQVSRTKRVALAAGIAEREGSRIYNSAVLVSPDGRIGTYRKVHLFDREKLWFTPGNFGFPVFRLGKVKVGLLVCFDWIYPEAMRMLALQGAQVVCHSANLVLPYCQEAMVTRAIENRLYIVTANRIGTEARGDQTLTFTGASQVVDPRGNVLIRATRREAAIRIVDVDPTVAQDKWVTPRNNLLRDRRPERYSLLARCDEPGVMSPPPARRKT